jgi:hypothetical protein
MEFMGVGLGGIISGGASGDKREEFGAACRAAPTARTRARAIATTTGFFFTPILLVLPAVSSLLLRHDHRELGRLLSLIIKAVIATLVHPLLHRSVS